MKNLVKNNSENPLNILMKNQMLKWERQGGGGTV
jgi:hypothetical protein